MIERINELAKISKERELTKKEIAERKKLREQYLKKFKKNFKQNLNNIYIKNSDGTIKKYEKPNK